MPPQRPAPGFSVADEIHTRSAPSARVAPVTPELIGIVSVGAALAALILGLVAWLHADIRDLRSRVDSLLERVARIEGWLWRDRGAPDQPPDAAPGSTT